MRPSEHRLPQVIGRSTKLALVSARGYCCWRRLLPLMGLQVAGTENGKGQLSVGMEGQGLLLP